MIIVGGGIAGLSAALEAGANGRSVLVIDANSVGGGHAVKAGGFALVGTPLQEKKGYRDSPEIAERDLLAWGEDADPAWVRRYVRASRTEVHDWLTAFGVRWGFILDTPEHSVPRFHFANGSALNVVVPLMRAAFVQPNLEFRWNTAAVSLIQANGGVSGVRVRDLRTGATSDLWAPAVIVATGGWQSNLDLVRGNWRRDKPAPDRLYAGAGYFALGSGIKLGTDAGAATTRMDHQVTFTTGLPDPRDPTGSRALLSQNPSAIWVNSSGQRFISEMAPSKDADDAVLRLEPATHWLIFDADGMKTLRVRDGVWLGNPAGIEPLKALGLIRQAESIETLAGVAGLPAPALEATVERWNAAVLTGNDDDFGRFTPAKPDRSARAISKAPFYAMQLFPMTRKSMGGLAIDGDTRVVDESGRAIPGLYAAGEVTGVAGINGSYGGEGTFLGPSVYLGRLAGQAAARNGRGARREPAPVAAPAKILVSRDTAYRARAVTMAPEALPGLVGAKRPGYWHFEVAHRIVQERGLDCTACHTPEWPTQAAASPRQRQL
ncbi:MAG: FAD-dependent oxidoreductase, partial [Gammaproteobacteria bacterium]|nr:FAD-dependent oxidoreductase [Gammaproteobacteria bacterium]